MFERHPRTNSNEQTREVGWEQEREREKRNYHCTAFSPHPLTRISVDGRRSEMYAFSNDEALVWTRSKTVDDSD